MGWTFSHMEKGQVGEHFRKALTWETDTSSNVLIKGGLKAFKAYYGAIETTIKATGEKRIWAYVGAVKWAPHDYNNFGLKDMDETCGPYYFDCPKSILNLLTPTDNEHAKDWRKTCWEKINNKPKKINNGDIIKLAHEVSFVDGAKGTVFSVYKSNKQTRYCIQYANGSYSAPRYKLRKALLGGMIILNQA